MSATNHIALPFSESEKDRVRNAIKNELILAFPTETVYGLGGNALSLKVTEKIYSIKGRDRSKSLPVLVNQKWVSKLCRWEPGDTDKLMEAFWPGPLTMILKTHRETPDFLTSSNQTLAIRVSSSSIVQQLIELSECPIIGTSANLAGKPECCTIDQVNLQLKDQVDLLIDGGEMLHQQTSTIVDCSSTPLRIVREGQLPLSKLNLICKVI